MYGVSTLRAYQMGAQSPHRSIAHRLHRRPLTTLRLQYLLFKVVLKCDVTIADDVIDALSADGSAAAGVPPIRGVFHAACPPPTGSACGKGDDAGTVGFETRTLLPLEVGSRFLEAKVAGELNLADATELFGLGLDFLAFFSSVSSGLGLSGDAGYAVANGCLDGLACYLNRERGFNTLSVQYGPWIQAGTAVEKEGAAEALRVAVTWNGMANHVPDRSDPNAAATWSGAATQVLPAGDDDAERGRRMPSPSPPRPVVGRSLAQLGKLMKL